jgi:hypothetical protein
MVPYFVEGTQITNILKQSAQGNTRTYEMKKKS